VSQRCGCGADKDEPHMHTCGFAVPELLRLLSDHQRMARVAASAWGIGQRADDVVVGDYGRPSPETVEPREPAGVRR
jgi:hypothetical protein